MSRKYKFHDQANLYFISFATVNWIDLFTRPLYKDIFAESLKFCIKIKGLEVYAWCIMTNHVHLIIGSDGQKLEDLVRDLKRHTSKEVLKAIGNNIQESRREWMFERAGRENSNNKKYQFWQQHNQPIELTDNKFLDQKLDYIHNNPVATGFVTEPEHYPYSSAVDYAGGKGLVEIELLAINSGT